MRSTALSSRKRRAPPERGHSLGRKYSDRSKREATLGTCVGGGSNITPFLEWTGRRGPLIRKCHEAFRNRCLCGFSLRRGDAPIFGACSAPPTAVAAQALALPS